MDRGSVVQSDRSGLLGVHLGTDAESKPDGVLRCSWRTPHKPSDRRVHSAGNGEGDEALSGASEGVNSYVVR